MKIIVGTIVATALLIMPAVGYEQDKNIGVSQELQEKINKAIENGVKWLKQQQQANGSFEPGSTQFPGGRTALAMLTLLRCGVPRDDDSIKKGFAWLKKSSLFAPEENSKNYCVCILILALEVKRVGVDTDKGTTVEVEDEDKARGWTYTMPTATVQSSFPKTSYASMTCIGVASLCLCRAELQKNSTYKRFFSKPVEAAIRDGIAWLGDKFPVKDRESKALFYYYTLYGLERVGALAKIVNIGSHLWYKEGAEDILSAQKPDGSWDTWDPTGGKEGGATQETCFCLLFLSNATFKVPGKGFQIETGKGAKKDK